MGRIATARSSFNIFLLLVLLFLFFQNAERNSWEQEKEHEQEDWKPP